jgi:hypothetical protein
MKVGDFPRLRSAPILVIYPDQVEDGVTKVQRKAMEDYRRRLKAKGVVRFEIQATERDAALIRRAARILQEETEAAGKLRAALVNAVGDEPKRGLKELLASAPWDDEFDQYLVRDRSQPRNVDL